MAELTANLKTFERQINLRRFPVKDGEIMYAGGIGAVNTSTGEAEMASDSANLVVGGRVESYIDNTNDGLYVNLKVGCFRWNNSETNAVTVANLNRIVYIEDDNTISSNPGDNAVIAGVLVEIETAGVWVDNTPSGIAAALGIILPESAFSQADAVADLTDNSSGTSGGDTIAEVTDVASAANAIATLAAKFNATLAELRQGSFIATAE